MEHKEKCVGNEMRATKGKSSAFDLYYYYLYAI